MTKITTRKNNNLWTQAEYAKLMTFSPEYASKLIKQRKVSTLSFNGGVAIYLHKEEAIKIAWGSYYDMLVDVINKKGGVLISDLLIYVGDKIDVCEVNGVIYPTILKNRF